MTDPAPTESYRPPNGTSGVMFMDEFCDRCERDRKYRETDNGEDGCPIVAAAFCFDVGDPGYPVEWVRDKGDVYDKTARCTAFEPEIKA